MELVDEAIDFINNSTSNAGHEYLTFLINELKLRLNKIHIAPKETNLQIDFDEELQIGK